MQKVIYKYELNFKSVTTIEMPKSAEVLTIQMQNGIPCIWAKLNPDQEKQLRTFMLIGTGHSFEDFGNLNYIGTIQDSYYVFHCFELGLLKSTNSKNIVHGNITNVGEFRLGDG